MSTVMQERLTNPLQVEELPLGWSAFDDYTFHQPISTQLKNFVPFIRTANAWSGLGSIKLWCSFNAQQVNAIPVRSTIRHGFRTLTASIDLGPLDLMWMTTINSLSVAKQEGLTPWFLSSESVLTAFVASSSDDASSDEVSHSTDVEFLGKPIRHFQLEATAQWYRNPKPLLVRDDFLD